MKCSNFSALKCIMCFHESTNPMIWYTMRKRKLSATPICRLTLYPSEQLHNCVFLATVELLITWSVSTADKKISCIISSENFNKIDINQGYTQIILICGLINLKNHSKVYIFIFVIKLPFQWYKKFQLNICYVSSNLIQIIKFQDDIMKKCTLTINILQFMYFVVNYFVPDDKRSGINPCTGNSLIPMKMFTPKYARSSLSVISYHNGSPLLSVHFPTWIIICVKHYVSNHVWIKH